MAISMGNPWLLGVPYSQTNPNILLKVKFLGPENKARLSLV
jgi:hypothetical protein